MVWVMLLLMMWFCLVMKLDSDDSRNMVNVLMLLGWLMWLIVCWVWFWCDSLGVWCWVGVCYVLVVI